ncbi:MAG TPA: potassium channel protein [Caldithrix abyssi]|uniref:Potassium channel protein n=1 Tax=Caldithrix abyssi TaxID=187145 RepID=A0A7V4U3F5_CALAY|nr:potassium channel protein [Caldithrix abyssi]
MAIKENRLQYNLLMVAFFLALLLLFGTIGYKLIDESWNWIDALYMTFISFSTVGFREVDDLSLGERIFTMVVVLLGIIVISMLSASVTSWFVQNELLLKRKKQLMMKQIAQLKDHIILCGAGDTGKTVVKELVQAKKDFVVIEENMEVIEALQEHYPHIFFVHGDATKDEVLEEANIKRAKGLISALSLDSDNLFVVVSARALNPNMNIISRAVDPSTEDKLYKAGANYVISPNMVEGTRMASVLLRPTVVSFIEVMMRGGEDLSFRMEEVDVPAGSSLVGKTLKEARIPQRTGLIVIAIKKGKDSRWMFNPSSNQLLEENDRLIVLGDSEKVDKLFSLIKE